jgi:oligogalacturonide lyase
MLRTPLASERIQRIDPHTGIKVIQLTSYPTPAAHLPYDRPSVTPDNQRVIFWAQRRASRNAPWDLYRCDTDGLNLYQLTERTLEAEVGGYYGRASSVMSLDGTKIYVIWDRELCCVDMETGDTESLMSLENVAPQGTVFGSIVIDDARGIVWANRHGDGDVAVRIDINAGHADIVELGGRFFSIVHGEDRIIVQRGSVVWGVDEKPDGSRQVLNVGDRLSMWNTDEQGGDGRLITPWIFAHATPLGGSAAIQGTGQVPSKCIWVAEEGKEPVRLAQGPYFWHSGPSFDGEWIISDTNWPDEGLQLIHVGTRHFAMLCQPCATQDHVEYGHPHPALSHDGRIAVFRSDRSGMSQVYIAQITDEFREKVISGEVSGVQKWF